MTIAELYEELKSLGLPVAYYQFEEKVTPPFIAYYFVNNNNDLMADNQNYAEISEYRVELYTVKKEPATEKLLEDKLKELRLPYSKYSEYIESEEMFQLIYQIQII